MKSLALATLTGSAAAQWWGGAPSCAVSDIAHPMSNNSSKPHTNLIPSNPASHQPTPPRPPPPPPGPHPAPSVKTTLSPPSPPACRPPAAPPPPPSPPTAASPLRSAARGRRARAPEARACTRSPGRPRPRAHPPPPQPTPMNGALDQATAAVLLAHQVRAKVAGEAGDQRLPVPV